MAGQRIGYKRVSTVDQNTSRQLDGVQVDRVFEDHASGKDTNRPALQEALAYAREGDVLVVHSMDRLGRNTVDLCQMVKALTDRGVVVEFHKEGLRFTGEADRFSQLQFTILAAVAQFERSLILERQREGIQIAKVAGRYKGGQFKLKADRADELRCRAGAGESKAALAREFGISRQSLYSYLQTATSTT